MAASRIVGSSSANFFWSSPEVAKAPPPSQAPKATEAADVESLTATDIVKHVAEAHSLSQAESRRVINTIFDSIKEVRFLSERCRGLENDDA